MRALQGNLVTISSSNENAFLYSQFVSPDSGLARFPGPHWIGMQYTTGATVDGGGGLYPLRWVSGASVTFTSFGCCYGFGNPVINWNHDLITTNGILIGANPVIAGNPVISGASWDARDWYGGQSPFRGYGIGEVTGSTTVFTNAWLLPGVATNVIPSPGLTLASGALRIVQTNAVSVLRIAVEDLNQTGRIDQGDNFILTEYEIGRTNFFATNTLARIPITQSVFAQNLGLAVAKYLPFEPAIAFTALPDGQIYSWRGTNSSSPLEQILFSSAHQGKAWHALSSVKLPEPGEGLIGLRIDPTNRTSCDVILWPPRTSFESPLDIPQTAPVARVLTSIISGAGLPGVDIDLRDAEGNASVPELQFRLPNSTNWSNAMMLTIDGLGLRAVTAQPGGSAHQIVWNAIQSLGAGFSNQISLRLRAKDVSLTGEWSEPVPFQISIAADNPVAADDVVVTDEDTPRNILVLNNDHGASGRILAVSSVSQAEHGMLTTNADSSLRYSPQSNYSGPDHFTYAISDGAGGAATASVTVTVNPVNDPPTISSFTNLSILLGGRAGPIAFRIGDPDSPIGELSVAASPSDPLLFPTGSLILGGSGSNRFLTVVPAQGQFGSATVTMRATDSGGLAVQASFVVTVTPPVGIGVTLKTESTTGAQNSTVTVPIKVEGFTNMASAQFSLRWDPTVARFITIGQFGLPGLVTNENFGTNLAGAGLLVFSWDHPAGQGINLTNGAILFALNFLLVGESGSSSPVQFDRTPIPIEMLDRQSMSVPVRITNGLIQIASHVRFSGTVRYFAEARPVPGVAIDPGNSNAVPINAASDGSFELSLPAGSTYSLGPQKQADDSSPGTVTTADSVFIRRHVLSIQSLASPYAVIAADVNNSSTVTTADITFIRRVILAIDSSLPTATWKFVRADQVFTNPLVPWSYESTRGFANATSDATNVDFVGIRAGDVNGSWTPASTQAAGFVASGELENRTSNGRLRLSLQPSFRDPDGSIRVPVRVEGFDRVTSLQFTLRWDPRRFAFVEMDGFGVPELDAKNFGEARISLGELPVSWDDPKGVGVDLPDGSSLFSVRLKPLDDSAAASTIRFGDSPTGREVTFGGKLGSLETQSVLIGTAVQIESITIRSDGSVAVILPTEPGVTYVLETSASLTTPEWRPLSQITGNGSTQVLVDEERRETQRFYRVRIGE